MTDDLDEDDAVDVIWEAIALMVEYGYDPDELRRGLRLADARLEQTVH